MITNRWIALVAREDGTTVEVQPSATGKIVLAGGGIAADGTGAVMLGEGDVLPVLSGIGGGQPDSADKADLTGDPSMTIAVPLEQYRSNYSLHAPTNDESNLVNVTAPAGAKITLDGQSVAGFVPSGGSGYGVARIELSNAGDGDHAVSGDQPFGIQVYGYGQNTSYWYPGKLDLEVIPQ